MSTVTHDEQTSPELRSTPEAPQMEVAREDRSELARERRGKQEENEVKEAQQMVAGGTFVEAFAGVAAIVLAIVGLAGVAPGYMLTIGTIALGLGLFLMAVAIAARYLTLLQETQEIAETMPTGWELSGGEAAGFVGGLAGIILGVLGLVGLAPVTLCAIAIIVAGGSLLLSVPSVLRLNRLIARRTIAHKNAHRFTREVTLASAGLQALAGVAGILLGIVALVGAVPATLVLVALLSMGASLLLTGSALGARMLVNAVG